MSDETGWRTITPDDVLEGALIESPHFPNRMRELPDGHVEMQLSVEGPRARVRLPIPDAVVGQVITEANEWHHDAGDEVVIDSMRRRWFEQVGDETHLVIEVIG